MNRATRIGRWLFVLSLPTLFLANSLLLRTKLRPEILNQYRAQRTIWFTAVWPFANTLFGLLAVIEFAWSAALMLLEKTDLQSWTSALVRKVMWIGSSTHYHLRPLLDSSNHRQL